MSVLFCTEEAAPYCPVLQILNTMVQVMQNCPFKNIYRIDSNVYIIYLLRFVLLYITYTVEL